MPAMRAVYFTATLLLAACAYAKRSEWMLDEAQSKEDAMKETLKLIALIKHRPAARRLEETPQGSASTNDTNTVDQLRRVFDEFKTEFGKAYATPEEEQQALLCFQSNLDLLAEVNLDNTTSFWAGLNQFSDMCEDELKANVLSELIVDESEEIPNAVDDQPTSRKSRMLLEGEVDWRARGKVTSIKYQGGRCGACWSFASTAALEVQYLITQGLQASSARVDLSNQQVISCYGQNGCKSGYVEKALAGASSKGITLEKRYPYQGVSGTCNRAIVDKLKPGEYLQLGTPSYTRKKNLAESTLMADVAKGPVLIYWTAERDFMYYRGGIFRPRGSCNGAVNHMLVVVGYVANKYWIVKNSWSTAWGEAGYGRIAMGGFGPQGPCRAYDAGFQPSIQFPKTFSSSVIG